MTSLAKNIKAIGKKPGTKMSLVFGKRIKCFFEFLLSQFWRKMIFFCRRMFYLRIHICLPTVTSILTWPKNDIDRTCVYSNELSRPAKNSFRYSDILWAVWDSHFSKTLSRILWVWLELNRVLYKDLPFELLKLGLCANAVFGRR